MAKYEFTAPYLMCSSDSESMSVGDLLAMEPDASRRFQELWLGYTESLGSPELRREIAALYDTASPEQVLVHAGAEEAIFNFMHVVLKPGDHVVVQAPYYQSLGEVALGIGAHVSPWRGDPKQGWALEIDDLTELLSPRTKLVVVNFPHNPTGFLPTEAFARELAALSRQHGFIIFADEVYRGLELDPRLQLSGFVDLDERAVSLGVMSKTYGLAGLRIGWIATRDRELYDQMAAFKDYTTICNSAPSEFLATLALRNAARLIQRNRKIVHANLDALDDFFADHARWFDWRRPLAGTVAFPRLKEADVDTFCADLVERAGVLLLPGTLYEPGLNHVRVGFGRRDLSQALNQLAAYLAES
ncbi:aminotransferase class I/II-fold pyridoxal phosphate-dependent enzyme [Desulfonatronum sp. SC1]|uniref:aminotransferase class I/II-fold pyridoxal phosphate-dependent enzyme n=1 Tax=Desulfonatronum sp. SC1 TaxID=2109626 RepID=UPI001E28B203|nr:aminotransferase class I/II-fold pyridoxal phosphate-dependent enzyme [Desulfonatronum sp. SC1]